MLNAPNITGFYSPDDLAGSSSPGRGQKAAAVGGVIGALAASSCCIVPLVLFSLGVSGSWIGNLTRLAPYQPLILGATVACLGCGYWLVYRAPRRACADGQACARPLPNRLVRATLMVATIVVLAALAFDFLVPLLLHT